LEVRKGKNNLYHKLQENTANNLIHVVCSAHIVHSAVQTASGCLPVDILPLTGKIYHHFHIYAVHVEALKSCEFTETEYKAILGQSKSRWLFLLPVVERPVNVFSALKVYFHSLEKCPVTLKNFS
jgi:hypothetical protein